jgi:hypothetical protein
VTANPKEAGGKYGSLRTETVYKETKDMLEVKRVKKQVFYTLLIFFLQADLNGI